MCYEDNFFFNCFELKKKNKKTKIKNKKTKKYWFVLNPMPFRLTSWTQKSLITDLGLLSTDVCSFIDYFWFLLSLNRHYIIWVLLIVLEASCTTLCCLALR